MENWGSGALIFKALDRLDGAHRKRRLLKTTGQRHQQLSSICATDLPLPPIKFISAASGAFAGVCQAAKRSSGRNYTHPKPHPFPKVSREGSDEELMLRAQTLQ